MRMPTSHPEPCWRCYISPSLPYVVELSRMAAFRTQATDDVKLSLMTAFRTRGIKPLQAQAAKIRLRQSVSRCGNILVFRQSNNIENIYPYAA